MPPDIVGRMSASDMRGLILALLSKRGWNQDQLARRLKTTQATVSRWVAGSEPRGDKRDAIRHLAAEVGLQIDGVVAENYIVPIMGRVGAGAHIEPDYEQVPAEGIEQVELPYAIADEMIGFRVVGNSMEPAYEEHSIVVVDREQPMPTDSMIGMRATVLAVTQNGDRSRYLKCIRVGAKADTYDLESINDRSPTIRGVRISWASPVRMVIPNIGLRIVRGRARTPRRRG